MSIIPAPTVLATAVPNGERRHEIEERRPDDGLARRQHARRHHGRNRIGGVVKTVDVVEDQGDRDEADDDPEHRRAIRA
jgi:hypothetical protein